MEPAVDFYPLLVVTLLAVAVPVVLHRIPRVRLPLVVGEILAGIVVGVSGLGLIGHETPDLEFLKIFGFSYLMFLSGLEIDFDLLSRAPSADDARNRVARLLASPLRAAVVAFLVTVTVSLLFALPAVELGLARDPLILALVLSTTSLGVVMPVLKEHGLTRTELGQYALVAAVVADFATIMAISIYVVLHTQGLSFDVLLVLVLLAATFLVYRVAKLTRRHFPLDNLVEELSHATGQLDIRGALALAVVFIALAEGLGIEVILGAFMAGAIVSLLSDAEATELRHKLEALGYGFFIPIFFIMVGVEFDVRALLTNPQGLLLVPILVGLAFAVKFIAALVYRPMLTWRETMALGAISSSRLSLIIAVSAIGVELGVIGDAVNAAMVLVAIVTVTVAPLLFDRLVPDVLPEGRRIVVVGASPPARLLATRLREHGEDVVILTSSVSYREQAATPGIDVTLVPDLLTTKALSAAGVDEARAVVVILEDEEEALHVATMARECFGVERVLARVSDPTLLERFRHEGIEVVNPATSTVIMLEGMVRHPGAFAMVAELDPAAQHIVDTVVRNTEVLGREMRELRLAGEAVILVLERAGEVTVPRGGTRLRRGDRVTIVGAEPAVEAAAAYLGVER